MDKKQKTLYENLNHTHNSIAIRGNLISIRLTKEFAILERKPNADGMLAITFSIPLTSHHADIVDQSGIAEVEGFSKSGTMVFTRKDFYESHKMIDIITDILKKYEEQKEPSNHLA